MKEANRSVCSARFHSDETRRSKLTCNNSSGWRWGGFKEAFEVTHSLTRFHRDGCMDVHVYQLISVSPKCSALLHASFSSVRLSGRPPCVLGERVWRSAARSAVPSCTPALLRPPVLNARSQHCHLGSGRSEADPQGLWACHLWFCYFLAFVILRPSD